jgi:hypothetical protein
MNPNISVKQMILNEIDKHPKGYSNILAEVAGFNGNQKGTNFRKVLNNESKEFENFGGFVKLIKYLWKENYVNVMIKYSNEINPNKKTARNLLELLMSNRKFDALLSLLDKMEQCTNNESREFAKMYRLFYKYDHTLTKDIDPVLKEISETNVNTTEMQIFKKLLLTYCFMRKNDFVMTKSLMEETERIIDSVENEYLYKMYVIRLHEIMTYNYLNVYNDTKTSRKYADEIIEADADEHFVAFANYIKGYSFFFNSYDNAVLYLNKSIEMYINMNRLDDVEDVKQAIEFLKIFWDKNECPAIYPKNKLLESAKNGLELDIDKTNVNITPEFILYAEGIKGNDKTKLMLSLIKHVKKNNIFMANLAKIELLKYGENEMIIEELMCVA